MQTITQNELKEKISSIINSANDTGEARTAIFDVLDTYQVVENNERCKLCGDLVYTLIRGHHHN